MTKSDLQKLKSADIYKSANIADISAINIDAKTLEKRVTSFFETIDNPYIFKVGDLTVKVNFNGDKAFSDAFLNAVNY